MKYNTGTTDVADYCLTESDEAAAQGNFKKYRISKLSRKTLRSRGITHLFPIQYMTFDAVYDGKDVIGQARMCSCCLKF